MRMMRAIWITFSLVAFLLIGRAGTTSIPNQVVNSESGREMNEYLSRLESFGFSGTVLAAKDDNILIHKAFGTAWAPENIPNHTNTLFSTASVTKQFTAAGILALEADGKLNVDDPITEFIEKVPDDKRGITIHHLLTHTAGFPPHIGSDEAAISREEFVNQLMQRPLLHEPGERYEYSNAGFSLAAAIIEIVSGQDYESYLRQRLFEPAGMMNTGLHRIEIIDTLVAHSQNPSLDFMSPADRPAEHWYLTGGGGLLSTAADMYRWHLALKENRVLPASATKKMFTPYIREYEDQPTFYGYGWVVQQSQRRDSKLIWHNGGAMPHNWGCAFYHYVDDNAVFIVFVNRFIDGQNPVDAVALTLSQIAFGEDYSLPPRPAPIADQLRDQLAGTYLIAEDTGVEISFTGASMIVKPFGQVAYNALFPHPMSRRLPKYNNLTSEMITAIASGEAQQAAGYWDTNGGGPDPRGLRDWWAQFDSLGSFESLDIYGSRMRGEAVTSFELQFTDGVVTCEAAWIGGKCIGLGQAEPPRLELVANDDGSFAGYSIGLGRFPMATFSDDLIRIDNGREIVEARRR